MANAKHTVMQAVTNKKISNYPIPFGLVYCFGILGIYNLYSSLN